MKKSFAAYYLILSLFVAYQIINTGVVLGKSIGYGYAISNLENNQKELLTKDKQLDQILSHKLAINLLAKEKATYQNINEIIIVQGHSSNLALR